MREQVIRILRLVEQGKIKPEQAAELIDALGVTDRPNEEPEQVAAGNNAGDWNNQNHTANGSANANADADSDRRRNDPFGDLFDNLEKATRATIDKVDFKRIADDIRTQTKRGLEEVQKVVEQVGKGEFWERVNIRGGQGAEKTQEMTFTLAPGKKLRVENPLGDILVQGGAEFAQVVAAVEVRAATKELADEKANQWTLLVEETAEGCTVKAPKPDGVNSVSADLNIRVPTGVLTEIRATSGDVTVLDTDAGVDIDATKGDARVRRARGTVRVYVTSGDVLVEESATERVHLETESGDIRLDGAQGHLSAKTRAGDVAFDRISPSRIHVETVNGDIRAALDRPATEQVQIHTVNGDVNLVTPDGGDFKVSLSTVNGEVSCDLPAAQVEKSERRWQGVIGDGSHTFEINTVRGEISVSLKDTQTT